MMTPDELAAIRQRCEAATPPPWNLCEIEKPQRFAFAVQCDAYSDEQPGVCGDFDKHWPLTQDDAEFIAHAREDIPALLAHIASLEAEKSTLRNVATGILLEKLASDGKLHGICNHNNPSAWFVEWIALRDAIAVLDLEITP